MNDLFLPNFKVLFKQSFLLAWCNIKKNYKILLGLYLLFVAIITIFLSIVIYLIFNNQELFSKIYSEIVAGVDLETIGLELSNKIPLLFVLSPIFYIIIFLYTLFFSGILTDSLIKEYLYKAWDFNAAKILVFSRYNKIISAVILLMIIQMVISFPVSTIVKNASNFLAQLTNLVVMAIMCLFSFYLIIIILENLSGFNSIRRSFKMVLNNYAKILGYTIIFYLIFLVILIFSLVVFVFIAYLIYIGSGFSINLVPSFLYIILIFFVSIIYIFLLFIFINVDQSFVVLLYFNQRIEFEDFDPRQKNINILVDDNQVNSENDK